MIRVSVFALAKQRLLMPAAGLAALAAAALPAGAQNSAVAIEPEVGSSSSASLPGMPPPPGVPPVPAAAAAGSFAAAPVTTAPIPPPLSAKNTASLQHSSGQLPSPTSSSATVPPAEPNGTASLAIVKWSIGADREGNQNGSAPIVARAGQPLYLRLTVQGGQAAVDQLRADGGIPIVVHWVRDDATAAPGAPGLTSELTIGHRGLASALAGEVEQQGRFDWHTWTSKSTLSPGQWSVSVTYPDGQPLTCGQSSSAQPCRFSINVG